MACHPGPGSATGSVSNPFVDDGAVEIVGTKMERDLRDLLPEHDPVGLEMGDVVEYQTRHRKGL